LQYNESNIYDDFIKAIGDTSPDIIGFSVVEPTFHLAIKLLRHADDYIKANSIPVVMGGVHAIMAPESIANYPGLVDFICVSEGEIAFVEFCQKLAKGKSVQDQIGFWLKDKDDSWVKNQLASLVDLEILPVLDFDLFPSSYLNKPMMGKLHRTISIELTRGCPYNCSYCCDHALTELFKSKGRWFRRKSLEKISRELSTYIKNYDPQFVYMMSESFLAGSLDRVKAFLDFYKSYAIPFWFNTRPEDINPKKAQLAKEAGCARISIGIESGNEKYRREIMNRLVSNEKIIATADILHDNDISFSVNIIIGSPGETRDMIFDSIKLAKRVNADAVSTHIFNPYYGTKLRAICVENNHIAPDMIADDFFQGYVLNNGTMSNPEIMGLFRTIPLYISFPESEYPRIRRAEKLNPEGNSIYQEFKNEFYQMKGWNN